MTQYEMVELLREKANVTYEEAKNALEQTNWDLLEAIVLLEREGKTNKESAQYSTKAEPRPEPEPRRSGLREGLRKLGRWLVKLIAFGNRNYLVVKRNKKEAFRLCLTAVVAILCINLSLSLIIAFVGLITGYRYSLAGENISTDSSVNVIMGKVNNAAQTVADSFEEQEKADAQSDDK